MLVAMIWTLTLWLASAIAVVYSAIGTYKTGGILPLLLLPVLLALLLPPARSKISEKLKFWPGAKSSLIAGFVIWLVQMGMFGSAAGDQQASEQARAAKESADRIAKARQDRLDDYNKNKASILQKIETALTADRPSEALDLANQYLTVTKDPDLARLQYRADVAVMKTEARDDSKVQLERRVKIYETLVKEDPANAAAHQAKLAAAMRGVEAQRTAAEAAKKRAELEAAVRKQLSGFDGSHSQVEAAIKTTMKNPKSYEHVKTGYLLGDNSITIVTQFRGTNSFGGVVPGVATAVVDVNGNVQSIKID